MVWDPVGCVVKIRKYPQYSGSEMEQSAQRHNMVADQQQFEKYLVGFERKCIESVYDDQQQYFKLFPKFENIPEKHHVWRGKRHH